MHVMSNIISNFGNFFTGNSYNHFDIRSCIIRYNSTL